MTPRTRAWLLILLISALCGLALGGVIWYRSRALSFAAMFKRLPTEDAVVLYIDFSRLRAGGILALLDGSKVGEDPEYQSFVRKTDFDYKQDLDAAMVAFAAKGKYMLLRGRFDWKSLRSYALANDGRCNNSFCKMPGSVPERRISFFPMQPNLMAMAVSDDDVAALRMNAVDARGDAEIPDAPLWLSIPPSLVKSGQSLPPGTQMFARSLERAQAVTLAIVQEGDQFAAKLNVRCASVPDASALAAELNKTTGLLREMIEREHQKANPADLSGFLTSGAFRSEGARVSGHWGITRALIENLLGGS
ncbi:MAG: hypothetical protein NTW28_04740 [Candidatus Solibacter sp.]|nr:hypothetical protein [Candidatus Solibacter sp.]